MTYNLPGIFGFTALPATLEGDDERIVELLRIMNWLSAPFGSEECLFKSRGVEGTHFEYNENGFPVANELYETENGGLTAYLGGNPLVNVNAEESELGPVLTEEAKAIYALGIDNPASNLFSPAAIENGPVLSQLIADAITNVVTGREDISAIDTLVMQWQERGGNDVRADYEAAFAANQG